MVTMALRAAHKAGEIIAQGYEQLDVIKVQNKEPNDYVTEIDKASERAIIASLKKSYPDHGFLGEETGHQPGQGEGADYLWIIDPLDGTTNFIHGVPHFAVSIACVYRGKVEHAVVYNPVTREEFTASRGKGAAMNGRRIRVTNRLGLRGALLGTGFPFRQDQMNYLDNYMSMFRSLVGLTAGIRRPGAASLDLAYVAAGRFDGFWEFGLKEWDMAAGILLITEAGGLVGDFRGGNKHMEKGQIVCGNLKVFKEILTTIQPFVAEDMK
ncbi:inositol monophosphatase family protein [Parendozoicomonas haliclonae]|uniref:Inositol-1-monophosphatase n=2 Tax=Parendozoicomonas haliclonae TaxID=1960125 RepID=A0A1X7AEQ6_9GAMM|nr:Inositol-1-monophosphatase [Parendozoicomonas haliclonae]